MGETKSVMPKLLKIAGLGISCSLILIVTIGIAMTHFLVDLWWFESLDLAPYFWLRSLYRYLLSGGVTLFFFAIFLLNFWAASRYLGVDEVALDALDRSAANYYRGLIALFQEGSARVYVVLSLVFAVVLALPFYQEWEMALLFFMGGDSKVVEPIFNYDVSYYLFEHPFEHLIQSELFNVFGVLSICIAVLYYIENEIVPDETKRWPSGAKVHLTILSLLTLAVAIWGLKLKRFDLVCVENHQPVYFGPGFVEMFYHLPLLWLAIFCLAGAGICAAWFAHTRKGLVFASALGALFLISIGLREVTLIPEMMDRYIVKPNPVKAESWAMKNNIDATLAAYDLNRFKIEPFNVPSEPVPVIDEDFRRHLYNIPVWDHEYLDDVYQQLQGIRPYYRFSGVDVGRYEINGEIAQVNIAARELNINGLPQEAQNWENRHLRYTHGYGAVISPAAQDGERPMTWYLKDLTLTSEVGFRIEKPDIYFGTENLDYAIVPNKAEIQEMSSADQDSSKNYSGVGGVRISSLMHRLLFALYLQDRNLFLSTSIDDNSQVLFRRNIVERVRHIAPFLALDGDPYLAVTPQRIFWIQDAYTLSNNYPISQRVTAQFGGDAGERTFNYIRNSVKVVIDAFDGSVDFYISDKKDPIISAFDRIYPGVFKPIELMPPNLASQLRYPKDLLTAQLKIYSKYHQTDPVLFFQQAETWELSQVEGKPVAPYYITARLDGCEVRRQFLLINPLSPIGRSNLSALTLAGSGGFSGCASGDKVTIYKFPREIQIDGPAQISALIDQDPEISERFSLWDQKGSHVIRGRIIILPLNQAVLYVQPVYLISSGNIKIPQLARVILAMGSSVAMDTTLEGALDKLNQKLEAKDGVNRMRTPIDKRTNPAMGSEMRGM